MRNIHEDQVRFVIAFEDRFNSNPQRIDDADTLRVEDHPTCGSIIQTKWGRRYRHPYTALWILTELGFGEHANAT